MELEKQTILTNLTIEISHIIVMIILPINYNKRALSILNLFQLS